MPATGQDVTALIMLGRRHLEFSANQDKALEAKLRKDLPKRPAKLGVERGNRAVIIARKADGVPARLVLPGQRLPAGLNQAFASAGLSGCAIAQTVAAACLVARDMTQERTVLG